MKVEEKENENHLSSSAAALSGAFGCGSRRLAQVCILDESFYFFILDESFYLFLVWMSHFISKVKSWRSREGFQGLFCTPYKKRMMTKMIVMMKMRSSRIMVAPLCSPN